MATDLRSSSAGGRRKLRSPLRHQAGLTVTPRARPQLRFAAQPLAGKAVVYVFEEEKLDPGALNMGLDVTARIGLDGAWVGAKRGKSYSFFPGDPGEHHVCVDWQSSLETRSNVGSAVALSAEAGKTYYFRATVDLLSHHQDAVKLQQIEDAEGQFLISSSARGPHQALDEVGRVIGTRPTSWILEIDITAYFDTIVRGQLNL